MTQEVTHGKYRYEKSHKVEGNHDADEWDVLYAKAAVFDIVVVGVVLFLEE